MWKKLTRPHRGVKKSGKKAEKEDEAKAKAKAVKSDEKKEMKEDDTKVKHKKSPEVSKPKAVLNDEPFDNSDNFVSTSYRIKDDKSNSEDKDNDYNKDENHINDGEDERKGDDDKKKSINDRENKKNDSDEKLTKTKKTKKKEKEKEKKNGAPKKADVRWLSLSQQDDDSIASLTNPGTLRELEEVGNIRENDVSPDKLLITQDSKRRSVSELFDDDFTDVLLDAHEASCGHVFVLHCDASGLAADCILVHNPDCSDYEVRVKCKRSDSDANRIDPHFFEANIEPLQCNNEDSSLCLHIAKEFIGQAGEMLEGTKSRFRRVKPLMALPMPGVGDLLEDDTIEPEYNFMLNLFPAAYKAVNKFGVDIALCLKNKEAYLMANDIRTKSCPMEEGPFWMLNESHLDHISKMIFHASYGRLSVFIGAGVSLCSGLPDWGGLLSLIADKAKLDEEEKSQLKGLGYLDQPTILSEYLGPTWKQTVSDCVREGSRFTPAHCCLNILESPSVTTNYDRLTERAAESCGEFVPTLPWDSKALFNYGSRSNRSLLKLHGCVKHPESIILSRGDYMRYPDSYIALRGRFQGMLLTSKMLFCGSSMTDENVHTIIDQCRKVMCDENGCHASGDKMGVILTMVENTMFRRLWGNDFEIISFGDSWSDNPTWYHDCFLDCLASGFANVLARETILTNPQFKFLLSEEEAAFQTELLELIEMQKATNIDLFGLLSRSSHNQSTPRLSRINRSSGYY